jgi:polyhydroxybutyrate depolymerase
VLRRAAAVAVAVLALAGCRGDDGNASSAPSTVHPRTTTKTDCTPARPGTKGTTEATVVSHGFSRTYVLYVPGSYTGRTRVPLVFNFHGHGSAARQQLFYGNLGPQSERDGFVIVAPEGQGQPRHFNLVEPPTGEEDDTVFTLDVLDQLEKTMCIDSTRVYSTGMSNGGAMSSVLACRAADRFAAVASVAAVVGGSSGLCKPARPIPVLAFMGTADPVVPFGGGQVHCCGGPVIPPTLETMAGWADQDACAKTPSEKIVAADVKLRSYSGCRADTAVELYVVEGGGHTWPGTTFAVASLGPTTHSVDASETIWRFFLRYHLENGG